MDSGVARLPSPMYRQRAAAADPTGGGDASTAVHDGFATIRRPHHYVGHKRRRAAGLHLEPVSEHVVGGGGGGGEQQRPSCAGHRPKSSYNAAAAALPPLPSDVPWWEIATRRRPKSCADFVSASSDKVRMTFSDLLSHSLLPPPIRVSVFDRSRVKIQFF